MHIGGLQKLSLLDYPGRLSATIFLNGCNFRCPFCHNAGLVLPQQLQTHFTTQDILDFLNTRRGKLDGVCITGGEPLLYDDISELIAPIKEMGFLIKLDTNGSFPEKLKKLSGTGYIDYVAMDIKNSKEKYPLTSGIDCVDIGAVSESAAFLMEGKMEYEFRTTVVRELHNYDDFKSIGEWLQGAGQYFLQNFVDSGNLISDKPMHRYSEIEMSEFATMLSKYFGAVSIRG